MLPKSVILPLQTNKILSGKPKDLLDYLTVLISNLTDMYKSLSKEIVPYIEETYTLNPSSLNPNSATCSDAIPVPGALLGDYVQVSASYDLQGLVASSYVNAADQVKICLSNNTSGAVDLAEGTWTVRVTTRRV